MSETTSSNTPGSDPTASGPSASGPTTPSTGDDAFADEMMQPEVDPGLHHVRSEHRGMPLRPDDDELELAVERDRVAAGLADYAPGDVPDATDPLPDGTAEVVDLAQRGLLGDTSAEG
jgi:hypothetical protein